MSDRALDAGSADTGFSAAAAAADESDIDTSSSPERADGLRPW